MVKSKPDQQIGYILRSYPRLSQTFVLNEILNLEEIGVPLQIFASVHPHEPITQPEVSRVRAPVHYLVGEHATGSPATAVSAATWNRTLHARAGARFGPRYIGALLAIARSRDIDRAYTTSSRWSCFDQAVRLALHIEEGRERGEMGIGHLHAHFAHDPTLIAQLVHRLTGTSFSFTAHARDLYQVSRASLKSRICESSAVVTCCRSNLDYLQQVAPEASSKFSLIYHGVNLLSFSPGARQSSELEKPLILSVGRLVEKKGFFDLLQALAQVKASGQPFRCEIYGEGPLREPLVEWITSHGLTGDVVLAGSLTQQDLAPVYQSADLFALTPFVAADGDQDGIPNVLVEAMASGLPVVSTNISGIPELITHGQSGLLFAQHDIDGIASAICELLDERERRARLGLAARRKVADQFDVHQAAFQLRELFHQAAAQQANASPNLFRRAACA